jgi:hypothetical protein
VILECYICVKSLLVYVYAAIMYVWEVDKKGINIFKNIMFIDYVPQLTEEYQGVLRLTEKLEKHKLLCSSVSRG